MHFLNNIKSFLYDKNYAINIYDNSFYAFNYLELLKLTDKEIIIKFLNFSVDITGSNFLVYKMTNKELLIKGMIDNMRFINEKHN